MSGENEEWLPCPFCGKELEAFGRGIINGKVVEQKVHPRDHECPCGFGIVIDKKRWNTRFRTVEIQQRLKGILGL